MKLPLRFVLGCIAAAAAALTAQAVPGFAQVPGDGSWRQYASPAEVGFDEVGLDRACAYADSVQSGAIMAIYQGNVLVACGDVARELEAHSVRKSLVSGLYGVAVGRGEIDLDAKLSELEIDDDAGLTADERSASLRDLLRARSGVYLGAAYAPSDQDAERPERGSHPPGSHWFYNNWDFNVAGVAYEIATGEQLYESFERRIAAMIGMEDWTASDGYLVYEPPKSRHPAHTFRISARDLARFGQLYLRNGRWEDIQVIPATWIEESTRPHSEFGDGAGYGYMWWTYGAGSLGAAYPSLDKHDLYMARGTGGQALWVIPAAHMVIVHRGDTDHNREIGGRDAWRIAEMILAAGGGPPREDPELVALRPRPLASQLPPLEIEFLPVPDAAFAEVKGDYELAPGAVARIYEWNGRPYIHMPGEGDAELYMLSDGTWTVRVVAGVRIEFDRSASGEVTGLEGSLGPQRFTGRRLEAANP